MYMHRNSLTTRINHANEAARILAKTMGSTKNYIRRLIVGFEIYSYIENNNFFDIEELTDRKFYFNYISDSLNRENITARFGVDWQKENPAEHLSQSYIKEWTKTFFDKHPKTGRTVKAESKDLSRYNAIIAHEEAYKAFKEEGLTLEQAYLITGEQENDFKNLVLEARKYLEQALRISAKVDTIYDDFGSDSKEIKNILNQIMIVKLNKDDEY